MNQIATIHGVPVYGACKFLACLKKIEEITPKKIWRGIIGIYFSDRYLKRENNVNVGGYTAADNAAHINQEITIYYKNGNIEKCNDITPYLYIESGIFPDEYWFAQTVLHEVGHHNEKPGMEYREREISAHLFSLRYLDHFTYNELMKPHPRYWLDAVKIHEETRKQ
jgi:hypothetical protein